MITLNFTKDKTCLKNNRSNIHFSLEFDEYHHISEIATQILALKEMPTNMLWVLKDNETDEKIIVCYDKKHIFYNVEYFNITQLPNYDFTISRDWHKKGYYCISEEEEEYIQSFSYKISQIIVPIVKIIIVLYLSIFIVVTTFFRMSIIVPSKVDRPDVFEEMLNTIHSYKVYHRLHKLSITFFIGLIMALAFICTILDMIVYYSHSHY